MVKGVLAEKTRRGQLLYGAMDSKVGIILDKHY